MSGGQSGTAQFVGMDNRPTSTSSKINMYENAGEVISKLLNDYGNVWPPRGDFTDWPESWAPYITLCDEMPPMLAHGGGPEVLRHWMRERVKQVNITEVMHDVNRHLDRSDQKLTGFSACLSHLISGYRWGILPALKEERERTNLEFPEELTLPFYKIMDLHGTCKHTNFFTLFYGNVTYDKHNVPSSIRFRFNIDPDVFSVEEEFFVKVMTMEVWFAPVLKAAAEFLILTEEARASTDAACRLLDRRSELLDIIKDRVTKLSKEFISFTTWPEIKRRHWTTYVQTAMAWGIDEVNGTSGGETIIANFLDAFLNVPGECLVFNAKAGNYSRMAQGIVDVLNAVRIEDPSLRFSRFLGKHTEDDLIWKQRADILRILHMWRLSHARVVARVLPCSEGLASGFQNEILVKNSLSESIKRELDERAKETKEAYFEANNSSKKPVINSFTSGIVQYVREKFF